MRAAWSLLVMMMVAGCSDDSFPPASAEDQRYAAKAYARDDLACQSVDDCCVVVDSCTSEALVVLASDRSEVEGLLGDAADAGGACTGCIPSPVQVSCEAGHCVGASVSGVSDEQALTKLRQTHCGAVAVPESSGAQMYVIGCGS